MSKSKYIHHGNQYLYQHRSEIRLSLFTSIIGIILISFIPTNLTHFIPCMTYSPNISYEQSQCNSVLILDKFITLALGITIFILCSIPVFSPRRYHHTLWITGVALSLTTIINYYLILPQVFRVVDQTQIILTPASSTPGI